MRIAVCGCGWCGSLLSAKLTEYGQVDVYEQNKKLKTVCGCGIPTDTLYMLAKNFNLNPKNYILWKTKALIANVLGQSTSVEVNNLCTFAKEKFMQDIVAQSEATFHFGEKFPKNLTSKYDIVVDASGKRALLGKLPHDKILTCFQVKAKFKEIPVQGFYSEFSDPSTGGYLWMFPLTENEAYVGYSAYSGTYAFQEVQKYLKVHNGQVLEKDAKLLRLNPPHESLPFSVGTVIGVGESVGTITRLGEGNAPSAKCVELLVKSLEKPEQYAKVILKEFGWLKNDHALFKAIKENNKVKMLYHSFRIQRIYRQRFQVKSRLPQAFFPLSFLRENLLGFLGM